MSSLPITAKGQITITPELLRHLNVAPGQKVEVRELPNGQQIIRSAASIVSIKELSGCLPKRALPGSQSPKSRSLPKVPGQENDEIRRGHELSIPRCHPHAASKISRFPSKNPAPFPAHRCHLQGVLHMIAQIRQGRPHSVVLQSHDSKGISLQTFFPEFAVYFPSKAHNQIMTATHAPEPQPQTPYPGP